MSLICMERNMGYHSITNFYKTLKFNWSCSKTSKCNVKWAFALYSVALTTTITHVDD